MSTRKRPARILVADDDDIVRKLVGHVLAQAGLRADLFCDGDSLIEALGEETQVCVLDLQMPGRNGIECLKRIKVEFPQVEVIILTNVNHAAEALAAIREGAFDYVTKPFDAQELAHTVRKASQLARQQQENTVLKQANAGPGGSFTVLGNSPAMQRVQQLIARMGPTHNLVLLTGESGTGKTLLARALHAASPRAEGPFIGVSCPSLPGELLESEMFGHEKGAFSGAHNRRLGRAELARGGTLFLDEIGDLKLALQAKLLTFIQDKSFYRIGGESPIKCDARIIAATNQDLEVRVKEGVFREDLYYRLNVLPIEVPPLRQRVEDIPALVEHFVAVESNASGGPQPKIEKEVYERLSALPWPGNIRELENTVIRAFTLRSLPDRLQWKDFTGLSEQASACPPAAVSAIIPALAAQEPSFPVGSTLAKIERLAIEHTMKACGNNKAEAARVLGIAEKSVYNKMKKYGL